MQVVAREVPVELIQNDARLDPDRPPNWVEGPDGVEVLRAVNNDSRPDRLAGQAGAGAAGDDRGMRLQANLNGRDEGLFGPREDDAGRHYLVDARVRAVEPAGRVVEPDLAVNVFAQVADEMGELLGA